MNNDKHQEQNSKDACRHSLFRLILLFLGSYSGAPTEEAMDLLRVLRDDE